MRRIFPLFCAIALGGTAFAQQPSLPQTVQTAPDGQFHEAEDAIITRSTLGSLGARKMVQAAVDEAARRGWTASIAIIDSGGNLLAFQRLDGATLGTIDVAQRKAKTALDFGMKSSDVGALVTRGGPAMLTLGRDMVAVAGGEPIVIDGQIVGAIGVSGGFRGEDDVLVQAALTRLAR